MSREPIPDLDDADGGDPATTSVEGHDGRPAGHADRWGDDNADAGGDPSDDAPGLAEQRQIQSANVGDDPEGEGEYDPDADETAEDEAGDTRDPVQSEEDVYEAVDDDAAELTEVLKENKVGLDQHREAGLEIPETFDDMPGASDLIAQMRDGGMMPAAINELIATFDDLQRVGVPEQANGYTIPQVTGHQWTDADKPVLDSFKATAHRLNLPQKYVDEIARWYGQEQVKAVADYNTALNQRDQRDNTQASARMKQTWGQNYDSNLGLITRMLDDNPKIGNAIREARLSDGSYLGNNPEVLDLLLNTARQRYAPTERMTGQRQTRTEPSRPPPPAPRQTRDTDRRLAEIERVLKTDADAYYAQGLDQEHMQLLSRRA